MFYIERASERAQAPTSSTARLVSDRWSSMDAWMNAMAQYLRLSSSVCSPPSLLLFGALFVWRRLLLLSSGDYMRLRCLVSSRLACLFAYCTYTPTRRYIIYMGPWRNLGGKKYSSPSQPFAQSINQSLSCDKDLRWLRWAGWLLWHGGTITGLAACVGVQKRWCGAHSAGYSISYA
ncbi:hypothetical protein BU26DRAFT_225408 [Trematosphaeria pertusa]|uniref:Uncharacterized protein n=1 Tax=Trematosphaeria pertusa TaxID=390896 RepID=A0A6A6ISU5_9PLEO|nr:uncharacterized protein BU26DRAFT_225408 [Trematosphaeria pertusa]KAF2253571.1 hypothetical protein BU26DRAFT_225408 [Trematosphaeria pertusa]